MSATTRAVLYWAIIYELCAKEEFDFDEFSPLSRSPVENFRANYEKEPLFNETFKEFPDVITDATVAKFKSMEYKGVLERIWWDSRDTNHGWNTGWAHTWIVHSTDNDTIEFSVNFKDFEAETVAYKIALSHAVSILRTPLIFRKWLFSFTINGPGTGSGGGVNSISRSANVNTGMSDVFMERGIFEEWWIREGCHGDLNKIYIDDEGWIEAGNRDSGYISRYADTYPWREDLAESLVAWLYVRKFVDLKRPEYNWLSEDSRIQQILQQIPNRLMFMEDHLGHHFDTESNEITESHGLAVLPLVAPSRIRLRRWHF